LGTAFRQPKQKLDFYSLFDNWMLKGQEPSLEQQHYIMAVLIRGGVFGASGKE
jgi:CRISPR-associated protein Csy3